MISKRFHVFLEGGGKFFDRKGFHHSYFDDGGPVVFKRFAKSPIVKALRPQTPRTPPPHGLTNLKNKKKDNSDNYFEGKRKG